jgi:hypothetical protein
MKTKTLAENSVNGRDSGHSLPRLVRWFVFHPAVVFLTQFHLRFYKTPHRKRFAYWVYHTEEGKYYYGISWLGWNLENVGYFYT